jgi:hypothetical protein
MNRGCRSLEEVLAGPVEINRDSPQAAGLAFCAPTIDSRGANTIRDLARGAICTFKGAGEPAWGAIGSMGPCLKFDGNDDWVSLVNPITTIPLSFAVWFWMLGGGGGSYGRIFDDANTRLYREGAGGWLGYYGGSTVNASTVITTTRWYHVAFTRTAGNLGNFYINGLLDGAANQATGTNAPGTAMYIGNRATPNRGWDGYMFDLRFYNQVVIPSVIWQMANPPTVWDLYRPVARFWPGYTASALLKLHEQYAFTGDCL